MLSIISDLKDNRWLQYILDEFSRINLAEFKIQIVNNDSITFENRIYYHRNCIDQFSIPNRSDNDNQKSVVWLSDKIFLMGNTMADGWEGICKYDIFWNAFVFLSRMEEYRSERRINSYALIHPRQDKSTFGVPVVNHLFNELERLIKTHFPSLTFGCRQKPVIELSHDVDYIKKTIQLRMKQTVFNGYNAIRALNRPSVFIPKITATLSFLISNPSYWCFDHWESLEKRYCLRSVFYFYAHKRKQNLKSWLVDPSYDIRTEKKIKRKIKQLIDDGFEIGLHGSYCAAVDEQVLSNEKAIIEDVAGMRVEKIRQHWLHYDEKITPGLHNKYFKYDSTIGWNDRVGFRNGCASRYRPYDHGRQAPFDYMVTPLVVMDAAIFDYEAKEIERQSKRTLSIVKDLQSFKTSHISISWHQRVCNADYRWQSLYETILREHIKACESL